jgi:hypothetical protein
LAGFGILALRLGEFDPVLYRGGFAAVAMASAVVIAVAVHPASGLGRALAWRPLLWVGTRSYAIYLWHWPVFMLTRPGLDIALTGWRNLVVRLVITAALAEASWRLVEQPFRRGLVLPTGPPRLLAGVAMATVTALLGALLVSAPAPRPPELLARALQSASDVSPPTSVPPRGSLTPETAVATPAPAQAPAAVAPPAPNPASPKPSLAKRPAAPRAPRAVAPTTARLPPPPPPEGAVLAVGDSVMATARDALDSASGGKAVIDAAVGRHVDAGLDVLQRYRDAGDLARVSAVVLHLGSNGPMTDRHFERLAQLVEGVPRVVVVNVRVPRRWEEQSNNSIRDGMPGHQSMRLADWYGASSEKGVLSSDGVHPTPSGAKVYARLIVEQLQPDSEPTASTTPPPDEPPPSTEPSTTTTEPSPTPTTTTTTTTGPRPESPAS